MQDKDPTQILEQEHRTIEKVVATMAVLAEDLERGQPAPAETLQDIVEFMRTFADRCHHGKEETHLFPALAQSGVPMRGCPVGVLLHEHQTGREGVSELARAAEAHRVGQPGAREALIKALRGLIELYPGHIWKEDVLLFPMTQKVLNQERMTQLLGRFAEVEQAMGVDVLARMISLAERLTLPTSGRLPLPANSTPGRRPRRKEAEAMFVNIIQFPPIQEGKDTEFREWFAWSNQEYAKHKGFIRRRLLRPREGGNYAALVEHESYEAFMAMHTSPTQAEASKRVKPLLDGGPTPAFYEEVMG